jgi:hypothetical protein
MNYYVNDTLSTVANGWTTYILPYSLSSSPTVEIRIARNGFVAKYAGQEYVFDSTEKLNAWLDEVLNK